MVEPWLCLVGEIVSGQSERRPRDQRSLLWKEERGNKKIFSRRLRNRIERMNGKRFSREESSRGKNDDGTTESNAKPRKRKKKKNFVRNKITLRSRVVERIARKASLRNKKSKSSMERRIEVHKWKLQKDRSTVHSNYQKWRKQRNRKVHTRVSVQTIRLAVRTSSSSFKISTIWKNI